jgi:hypothetical protein
MDDNANVCGEFGKRCCHLSEVREIAAEPTCADFAIWRLLPTPLYQVYEPNVDVLVVYCPSLILIDTILIATAAEYCG